MQESLKESLRNNEALRSEIEMEPKVKDGSKNENALDIHYPPPPSLSTTGVPSTPESNQIECKIDTTDAAIKGQTVSSSYKPALLENGINILVPPFVESGDTILVDTRTIEYIKKI